MIELSATIFGLLMFLFGFLAGAVTTFVIVAFTE